MLKERKKGGGRITDRDPFCKENTQTKRNDHDIGTYVHSNCKNIVKNKNKKRETEARSLDHEDKNHET